MVEWQASALAGPTAIDRGHTGLVASDRRLRCAAGGFCRLRAMTRNPEDVAMIDESPLGVEPYAASTAGGLWQALAVGVLVFAVLMMPASDLISAGMPLHETRESAAAVLPESHARFADFAAEQPSPDARHVADWVADSGDSADSAFVLVDKKFARVYVFDAHARLRASSPVLLGAALGDDSVADIGTRRIADIRPEERTTPAGRFVAERGRNAGGEDVIWVDYDAAVSMHRVRPTNPAEQRLQRLATPTVDDNRISYGCINVPAAFYESFIRPLFAMHHTVVYVLPDVKSLQQVFGSYDVAAAAAHRR